MILEGTNLYWTLVRFNDTFATKTTNDLIEGTNLYYTTGRFTTDFNTKLTGIITTTGITNNTNAITNNSTLSQIGLMKLGAAGTNIGTLQFYNSTNTDFLQISNSANSSTISTNGTGLRQLLLNAPTTFIYNSLISAPISIRDASLATTYMS